ncbi:phosphotransferase family protein [Kribbella sp. DT2]|uniref:phosphotransferase family protein n=1 Tax=Kribbella sp. DT2 TaxID=3393427 RepID=UPI003CF37729
MDAWGNLRADLEWRTGEPVLAFEPAASGSGGIKGIVRTAGDQYFVKAVPLDSPWLADCRVEAADRSPQSPRLRWTAEYADHFVLVFDVAPGHEPAEPWMEDELRRALAATDHLEATYWPEAGGDAAGNVAGSEAAAAGRGVGGVDASIGGVVSSPASGAGGVGLPSVVERMRGRCSTWRELELYGVRGELDVEQLSGWERANLRRLAEVEGEWERLVVGDALLHFDLRHDNLRIDGRRVWVLDWGRACFGPDWVDAVCLLLESSIGSLDADALFRETRRGAAADPAAVDAFLVALASYWRHVGSQPADEASAWIRPRQVRSGEATVGWLRRRWG